MNGYKTIPFNKSHSTWKQIILWNLIQNNLFKSSKPWRKQSRIKKNKFDVKCWKQCIVGFIKRVYTLSIPESASCGIIGTSNWNASLHCGFTVLYCTEVVCSCPPTATIQYGSDLPLGSITGRLRPSTTVCDIIIQQVLYEWETFIWYCLYRNVLYSNVIGQIAFKLLFNEWTVSLMMVIPVLTESFSYIVYFVISISEARRYYLLTKTLTNKPKFNLEGFLMSHFLSFEMQE
jgi:hypothetical protein